MNHAARQLGRELARDTLVEAEAFCIVHGPEVAEVFWVTVQSEARMALSRLGMERIAEQREGRL